MEVLSWLIRSVPLASAAALAQMLAPFLAFPRVTTSSLSTLMSASAAETALRTALLALPLKSNSYGRIDKAEIYAPLFL